MCHDKTKHPYDAPIRDPGNPDLHDAIPTQLSVEYGYESEWFTLGRASSIGKCLKCGGVYAAPDSRFGFDNRDDFKSLYLS